MMRVARTFITVSFAVVAAAAISAQQRPPDPSKENFERLCGTCHEPERSTSSRRTRDQWIQTVNQMVARGAEGTDDELMAAVEYLTREHGRVNVNLATAADIALVLGLTPAEAEAIVQYRRDRGTFEDVAGVERVPGVDAGKLAAKRTAMVFGSRVASNTGRVPVAALTAANNWPGVSGGPQRESWARTEAMLSKGTIEAVKLLYSRKLDDRSAGPNILSPPLVLGNLISYRGFKEMLFVADSSNRVYSIDAVLNRVLWTTRLPITPVAPQTSAAAACGNGPGAIVMTGSAAGGLGGVVGIRRPGSPPPGVLPAAATSKSGLVIGLSNGFGRNGLLLSIGSDGQVHPLYQSNGTPFGSPIKFLPAGSRIRSVNLSDNSLYAATVDGCGGSNAVYAVDLTTDAKTVARFETGDAAQGSAGTAVGSDGTVYVHAGSRVLALTRDLKEKDHFLIPSAEPGITPAVFRRQGSDVIVAAGSDRLVLLAGTSLGGADHRTPLAAIETQGTLRGAFATWEDPETGIRWIYAPVQKSPSSSGGAIAAFKVEERGGRPVLVPGWISPEMIAPVAPVVANGLVFALAAGGATGGATLRILDASTGRLVYTSGSAVRGVADPATGVALANGRAYFSTTDGTVYSFGIPTEH